MIKEQQPAKWAWLTKENLYYFAFVYAVFLSFVRMTSFAPTISPNLINRCSYLAVVLLAFKLYFLDHLNWRQLLGSSLVILVAAVSWRQTLAVDILTFVMFVLAARGIDFRRLMRLFAFEVGIMLIYTILISQVGVIKDAVYQRGSFDRHALGTTYPTDLAAHFFYLTLAYAYLRFDKLHWPDWVGMILVGGIVFVLTEARTDFLLTILAVPVLIVAKRARRGLPGSKVVASLYWMIAPIAAYCTVMLSYFYNGSNRLMSLLNKVISTRLELSKQAIDHYGLTLIGQRVIEHGYGGSVGLKVFHNGIFKYFYIDSSYARLAVIYGLVIGILIIVAMAYIGFKSTQVRGYCLAAIMLLIGIHCIIEQHLLDICYNPFIIALLAQNAYWGSADVKTHSGGQS